MSCASLETAIVPSSFDVPPISTPNRAGVVLYVDLDGVVQHEAVIWRPRRGVYMCNEEAPGRTLFEWLPILEKALAPFPEVALVLSSTWCIRPGYAATLKRFPAALRSRFVGGTFHRRVHGTDPWVLSSFKATSRGMQVWSDVYRRKPAQWLALDDDDFGWPTWALENLVRCDGSTGLPSPRVQAELREKLKRCHEALHRAT